LLKICNAIAAAIWLLAVSAWAEDYPGSRPVTVMMPYAAGGPGDVITRITAQGLSKYLGGQFIVENLAGAGGTIGTAKVAGEPPDGHYLLVMHFGHAANTALYPNLRYDAIKDFEPVGIVAESPMAFVARSDFPAKDFKEFVAYVKADRDKLTYGFAGVGSALASVRPVVFQHGRGNRHRRALQGNGTGADRPDGQAVRFHVRPDPERRSGREGRQHQGLCRDHQGAASRVPGSADGVGSRPSGL
jgi:tripartite-type tricarboxylate transporter receptor subunit TctC